MQSKPKTTFFGLNDLSNLPSNESRPHAIQMMKLMPTEPVRSNSPEGETNIPDPATNYSFVAYNRVDH